MPGEAAVEPAAETLLGRFWQSGRLGVVLAAFSFGIATLLPLLVVQRTGGAGPRVRVSPVDMLLAEGVYGRELKSVVLVALPGAALALFSFVLSRRTRAVMLASRPLVFVVSLMPVLASVLPVLKIEKRHRFVWALGPGAFIVLVGAILGVVAALRFGRGVQDTAHPRDDDED